MNPDLLFIVNSIVLGAGLAMDAFSVSLANGLNEPDMKHGRMMLIAGTFAFFQFLMPMAGWLAVHTIVEYFSLFHVLIPWIALALLLFIGGKMLWEGLSDKGEDAGEVQRLTAGALILQGIATSIDALSVGLTLATYRAVDALLAALIIAVVTYLICRAGLLICRRFGVLLGARARVLGGAVLIGVGLEIFIRGVFF
jgi:putative Mn2+ efflux pump MntP